MPHPKAEYVRLKILRSYHFGAKLPLNSNIRFATPFAAPSVLSRRSFIEEIRIEGDEAKLTYTIFMSFY